jgi:arylsulfatase A-like enzyme
MTTQAEASNSMTNCGCFPVNHTHPGPQPPSGYPLITPHGDQCVVGGGVPSDWCYPCTNYYYPNASDPRKVTDLQYKIPGDDSTFLVDHFEKFVQRQRAAERPWLAHICFHAIHEPHPAMPEFYDLYEKDPDYLGALTMWDKQVGRLRGVLEANGVAENTVIMYTTDNGPHQGKERSDIHYSTNFLRGCKVSAWEGGLRVPGLIHYPQVIIGNWNVTTPAITTDFLPTIMRILEVDSDNPAWALDGIDLLRIVHDTVKAGGAYVARNKTLGFSCTGGQEALIDNNYKLLHNPGKGQCDGQAPYTAGPNPWKNLSSIYMLFDLVRDYHELHDLSQQEPERKARMMEELEGFLASVKHSQVHETKCTPGARL